MFSGIIEGTGIISSIEHSTNGNSVAITSSLAQALTPGESIAVNGVCLTVTRSCARSFSADLSNETLKRTTFSFLPIGTQVNLERPLVVGTRLGGHFVQGHVDGIGKIQDKRTDGQTQLLDITYPKELSPYLVEKGSIAVDGISLTVAVLKEDSFAVALIPYTIENTNLKFARIGNFVNLEGDILAKHIGNLIQNFPLLKAKESQ